jgi:hypothetical protein
MTGSTFETSLKNKHKKALLHFIGLASNSKRQQLMSQTNSKDWFLFLAVHKFTDVFNRRVTLHWIPWTVAQKNSIKVP